jgi:hypothetical protein
MKTDRAKNAREVLVSMDGSPSHYCTVIGTLLLENSHVKLLGLEGAMVIAVDAANRAVREGLAEIEHTHTSTVAVVSKVTGETNQRSKIEITLHAGMDAV